MASDSRLVGRCAGLATVSVIINVVQGFMLSAQSKKIFELLQEIATANDRTKNLSQVVENLSLEIGTAWAKNAFLVFTAVAILCAWLLERRRWQSSGASTPQEVQAFIKEWAAGHA